MVAAGWGLDGLLELSCQISPILTQRRQPIGEDRRTNYHRAAICIANAGGV